MTSPRPTFVLRLRAEPGIDAGRALRAALKHLLRVFNLRCLEVREETPPPPPPAGETPGVKGRA